RERIGTAYPRLARQRGRRRIAPSDDAGVARSAPPGGAARADRGPSLRWGDEFPAVTPAKAGVFLH
ncbi:hypothetical protein DKP78_20045, partial [Enterococcus faecium]